MIQDEFNLNSTIQNDQEFWEFLKDVIIPSGGVVPNICEMLLPKAQPSEDQLETPQFQFTDGTSGTPPFGTFETPQFGNFGEANEEASGSDDDC